MIDVAINYRKKKKSKDKLIKVAVIGCGGGGLMHISHYLWHNRALVKAVFDIDKNRFIDLKNRFPFAEEDILKTTKLDDILNDDEIDIVSVATPDHTHAFYALEAINAGKNVLCEKPMCTSIQDAKKLIVATNKSDKKFSVFQQMRYVPRNSIIKSMIDNGKFGEIFFIFTGYIHDMRERAFEFSEWRKDPVNFQHPIYGGQHNIDLMRWLAGDIVEVFATGVKKGLPDYPTDDTYLLQLKLKNGGIGNVITCFAPVVPKEYHPLRIYGTNGSVHGDKIFLKENQKINEELLKNSRYLGIPQFREQISKFIDAVVNNKTEFLISAKDGAKTVAVCEAALKSLQTKNVEKVEKI